MHQSQVSAASARSRPSAPSVRHAANTRSDQRRDGGSVRDEYRCRVIEAVVATARAQRGWHCDSPSYARVHHRHATRSASTMLNNMLHHSDDRDSTMYHPQVYPVSPNQAVVVVPWLGWARVVAVRRSSASCCARYPVPACES